MSTLVLFCLANVEGKCAREHPPKKRGREFFGKRSLVCLYIRRTYSLTLTLTFEGFKTLIFFLNTNFKEYFLHAGRNRFWILLFRVRVTPCGQNLIILGQNDIFPKNSRNQRFTLKAIKG